MKQGIPEGQGLRVSFHGGVAVPGALILFKPSQHTQVVHVFRGFPPQPTACHSLVENLRNPASPPHRAVGSGIGLQFLSKSCCRPGSATDSFFECKARRRRSPQQPTSPHFNSGKTKQSAKNNHGHPRAPSPKTRQAELNACAFCAPSASRCPARQATPNGGRPAPELGCDRASLDGQPKP